MTLLFCGRSSNIPRYLPRTTRAASLLCILMRSAPVELCDTAEIAAAVSSSSLWLGTGKTLMRWPSSPSSQLHFAQAASEPGHEVFPFRR